jgi:glyoxylase-like metal-dependent hydrolase (beta-lactamase superfamily II)
VNSSTPVKALSPPSPEEFELSLFGPGYGEGVALHVGLGNWLIVDSCLEPGSNQPACLRYLRKLGVDVATQVKLVIVTHWHDDHIRGIAQTLRECSSALPVVSSALFADEFLQLFSLYSPSSTVARSGIDEFHEFFKILRDRKSPAFA